MTSLEALSHGSGADLDEVVTSLIRLLLGLTFLQQLLYGNIVLAILGLVLLVIEAAELEVVLAFVLQAEE